MSDERSARVAGEEETMNAVKIDKGTLGVETFSARAEQKPTRVPAKPARPTCGLCGTKHKIRKRAKECPWKQRPGMAKLPPGEHWSSPDEQFIDLRFADHEELERMDDDCSGMLPGAARIHALSVKKTLTEQPYVPEFTMRHEESIDGHAARAAKYGSLATLTGKEWCLVLRCYGDRCAYCGSVASITMDHVTPLRHGGDHAVWDVVPACSDCNSSKHARPLEDWAEQTGRNLRQIQERIGRATVEIRKRLGDRAVPLFHGEVR